MPWSTTQQSFPHNYPWRENIPGFTYKIYTSFSTNKTDGSADLHGNQGFELVSVFPHSLAMAQQAVLNVSFTVGYIHSNVLLKRSCCAELPTNEPSSVHIYTEPSSSKYPRAFPSQNQQATNKTLLHNDILTLLRDYYNATKLTCQHLNKCRIIRTIIWHSSQIIISFSPS